MAIDLAARLKAAQDREAAAKAVLDADADELAARAEVAEAEARATAKEREVIALSLARRLERAQAAAPDVRMREVTFEERPDTFIVADPGSLAYRNYTAALARAQKGNKDQSDGHLVYARAAIVDWNGATDWNAIVDGNANGKRLNAFLRDNAAMTLAIANVAATLAGFTAEERKSGG